MNRNILQTVYLELTIAISIMICVSWIWPLQVYDSYVYVSYFLLTTHACPIQLSLLFAQRMKDK